MQQTLSIYITGKVQGVFYRQSTREKARSIGVTGVVKNLPDGRVHIVATGMPSQLDELVDWCKTGPPKAKVTNVKTNDMPLQAFEDFSIER